MQGRDISRVRKKSLLQGGNKISNPKEYYKKISALFPGYGTLEGGNITTVYLNDGQVLQDNRTTAACLNSIARYFAVDISALRASIAEEVDCTNYVPLPFCRNLVLIPVKVRVPLYKKDGATGFVNFLIIDQVVPVEPKHPKDIRCYLHLKNGLKVASLYSAQYVNRKIKQGQRALRHYLDIHSTENKPRTDISEKRINSNKTISFSDRLIFKLITTDDDIYDDSDYGDNRMF